MICVTGKDTHDCRHDDKKHCRYNLIGVATRLKVERPRNRDLISGRGNVFFLYPKLCNRLWGPPSNLFNVYRCKTAWKWNWLQDPCWSRGSESGDCTDISPYIFMTHTHTLYFIWTESVLSTALIGVISVGEKLPYFCRQSNECYWLHYHRVTRENVYYSRIRTCMCLPQSWASKHSTQVAPPAFPGRFGVCTIDHFWPHCGEPVKWKINCIVERDVSNEL